jgi:NAD(P)-dependent dehydrogenase (short-subunit alcohol dehydrogenase family)
MAVLGEERRSIERTTSYGSSNPHHGSQSWLGFEFASQYLADGWRVFAACRNPDAASKLRRLAQGTGGMLNVLDVTDAESVRNAGTQLKDVAIDVLISSAGIAGASGQKTGNVDYESWAHKFNVNTMGPLRVLESFSDHIASSRPKSDFFGGIEPNRIFDRARRDRAGVRFAAEGSRLHDLVV